jgi:hypothetical protein
MSMIIPLNRVIPYPQTIVFPPTMSQLIAAVVAIVKEERRNMMTLLMLSIVLGARKSSFLTADVSSSTGTVHRRNFSLQVSLWSALLTETLRPLGWGAVGWLCTTMLKPTQRIPPTQMD